MKKDLNNLKTQAASLGDDFRQPLSEPRETPSTPLSTSTPSQLFESNIPLFTLMSQQFRFVSERVEGVAKRMLLRRLIHGLRDGAFDETNSAVSTTLLDAAKDIAQSAEADIEEWIENNYLDLEFPVRIHLNPLPMQPVDYVISPTEISQTLALEVFTELARNAGPIMDSRTLQLETANEITEALGAHSNKTLLPPELDLGENTPFALVALPDKSALAVVFDKDNWYLVDPMNERSGDGWISGRFKLLGGTEAAQRDGLIESLQKAGVLEDADAPIALVMSRFLAPKFKKTLLHTIKKRQSPLSAIESLSQEEINALALYGKLLGLPDAYRKERLLKEPQLLEVDEKLLEEVLAETPDGAEKASAKARLHELFKKLRPFKDAADKLLYIHIASLTDPAGRLAILREERRTHVNERALVETDAFIAELKKVKADASISDNAKQEEDLLEKRLRVLRKHGINPPVPSELIQSLLTSDSSVITDTFKQLPRSDRSRVFATTAYHDVLGKTDQQIREDYLRQQANAVEINESALGKLPTREKEKTKTIITECFSAVANQKFQEAAALYEKLAADDMEEDEAVELLKTRKLTQIHRGALESITSDDGRRKILEAFRKVSPDSDMAHEYLYRILLSIDNKEQSKQRLLSASDAWRLNETAVNQLNPTDQEAIRQLFQQTQQARDEEDYRRYEKLCAPEFDPSLGVDFLKPDDLFQINERVLEQFTPDNQLKIIAAFKAALLPALKPSVSGESVVLETSQWVARQLAEIDARLPQSISGGLHEVKVLNKGGQGTKTLLTHDDEQTPFIVKTYASPTDLQKEKGNYDSLPGNHPNVLRCLGQRKMLIKAGSSQSNGEDEQYEIDNDEYYEEYDENEEYEEQDEPSEEAEIEVDVLVFEYVDGMNGEQFFENLARDLKEGVITQTDFSLALHHWTVGAMRALAFGAMNGLAHLDVKLANIMVDSKGRIILIDWGFSRKRHFLSWSHQSPDIHSPFFRIQGVDATGLVKMFSEVNDRLRWEFDKTRLTRIETPMIELSRLQFIDDYGERLKQQLGGEHAERVNPPEAALQAKGVRPDFTLDDLRCALDPDTPFATPAELKALKKQWRKYDEDALLKIAHNKVKTLTSPVSSSIEEFIKQAMQAIDFDKAFLHMDDNPYKMWRDAPRREDRSHIDFLTDPPGGEEQGAKVIVEALTRYKNHAQRRLPSRPPTEVPDLNALPAPQKEAIHQALARAKALLENQSLQTWDAKDATQILSDIKSFPLAPDQSVDVRTLRVSQIEQMDKTPTFAAHLREFARTGALEDKVCARRAFPAVLQGHQAVLDAFGAESLLSTLQELSQQPQTKEVKKAHAGLMKAYSNTLAILQREHDWSSSPQMGPIINLMRKTDLLRAMLGELPRQFPLLSQESDPAYAGLMEKLVKRENDVKNLLAKAGDEALSGEQWDQLQSEVKKQIAGIEAESDETTKQLKTLLSRERNKQILVVRQWYENALNNVHQWISTLQASPAAKDTIPESLKGSLAKFLDTASEVEQATSTNATLISDPVAWAVSIMESGESQLADLKAEVKTLVGAEALEARPQQKLNEARAGSSSKPAPQRIQEMERGRVSVGSAITDTAAESSDQHDTPANSRTRLVAPDYGGSASVTDPEVLDQEIRLMVTTLNGGTEENSRINDIRAGGHIPPNAFAIDRREGEDSEDILILRSQEPSSDNQVTNVYTALTARQASKVGRLPRFEQDIRNHTNGVPATGERNGVAVPADGPELEGLMKKIKKTFQKYCC